MTTRKQPRKAQAAPRNCGRRCRFSRPCGTARGRQRRCASVFRGRATRTGRLLAPAGIPIAILEASNRGRLAGTGADPLRTHGPQSVHLPARLGGTDGVRPRHPADHRHQGAGVRRLPPAELRRVCHARAEPGLRPQRLRRDASGAVGMGSEAPGRELPDRGAGQSPVRRRGPARGPGVRARVSGALARVLAAAAAGGLVPAPGRGDADQGGARRQGEKIPAADRRPGARARHRKSLSQDHDAGRRAPPHRRSAADPVSRGRAGLRRARPGGGGGLPRLLVRRAPRPAGPLPPGRLLR